MAKPTLILVGPLPPPVHGVTIFTQQLLGSNALDLFDVVHLDTSDHRPMASVGSLDIRNVLLGLLSYWHLLRLCAAHRPDVVYVPISQTALGFLRDSVYLVLPRLLFGAAVVIHVHGGHFGKFYATTNGVMRLWIDLAMRCVGRVVVLADCFKPMFGRWFDQDEIDVVPNGTDLAISGVEEKLLRLPDGALNVTFVSNLIPTKGIGEFVEAACAVLKTEPNVTFFVAGAWSSRESPEEGAIDQLLDSEGLRDRIRFLGERRDGDKAALLALTDIYVLPTYYPFEGQPIAILEAMAAGCAVIATDHAAIPETVLDGRTGIIVPVRDVEALSAAIRRLCRDREQLRSMAKASYARYRATYTLGRTAGSVAASIARAIEPADVH